MKELQQEHAKSDFLFGIEPTGHYWFNLAEYLGQQGIPLVIVNPHHVHKSKELEDNSQTKNDYKDAKVIADLVRNGKLYTHMETSLVLDALQAAYAITSKEYVHQLETYQMETSMIR